MKSDHQVQYGRSRGLHSLIILLLVFCSCVFDAHASAPSSPVVLSKTDLPARGSQESILTITKFGRYAVTVKSEQGTGLQLVDRMAGPGAVFGAAGERDGRVDQFLERGDYKIVTHGHDKASGSLRLDVRPFEERNVPQPPALVEYKLTAAELRDFEQASYWVEIRQRKRVALEAAGRSLADMRLWKDGGWLLDAQPVVATVQPQTGRPLRVCRLTVELEPGLYLLTAYGGPALPWAEDNGLQPFYLRSGIPQLGSVTRKRFTVSPFGTDRFIVPGSSTYFRIELPEARELSLQAGWLNGNDPFGNSGPVSAVRKNSSPPAADLRTDGSGNSPHIVTITGEAGSSYVFQHFESKDRYSFQGTGDYWISSVHSGHPGDSVDATAILVSGRDSYRTRPLQEQTIDLDGSTGYSRRANLLDKLTLFLRIKAKGRYEALAQGLEARFVIEPFFTYRPSNYARPGSQPSGYAWDLDAGYYVLTVEPLKKGIMDLVLRPASDKKAPFFPPFGPVKAGVRFPVVSLDRDTWYNLYLNNQPEVNTGLVVRALPLDLSDPLPLTQAPDQSVAVPFRVTEEGTLRAEAEDGSLLDLSVDSGPWQKTYSPAAGTHTVSVRTGAKETINYALHLEPRRLSDSSPLPAVSQAALEGLPKFPVLTDKAPLYFDLNRESLSTFNVRADKSGLYQVQSTGLLATEGNLRSRTTPQFVRESENGKGRNFLIRQYLHEGDYQITVATRGQSRGHGGVSLERSGLIKAGFLTSRAPARISLPAGTAAAYQFVITKPGRYRIRSLGLGRTPKCRLEDKDGWPLIAPNSAADITRVFEKGRYRLILLPETTDARIVTVINELRQARRFKGHGPHQLPPAKAVDHTWMEPEAGKTRRPDEWKFQLPADGEVSIELTGEMQADLMRIDGDGTPKRAAFIPPARGWQGRLQAGLYRMDAVSLRVNNQASYRVAVRPLPLMPGMSRDIAIPSVVPVAVGQAGVVEVSSFGSVDVKARLTTEDGTVIAENDDRPDDWNFHLATALKPGNYRLYVEPVGAAQGKCSVSVRVPTEVEKSALVLPASAKITLADTVQLFPLTLPAGGELLMLSAHAPENVGLAVEVAEQGGWRRIGTASGRRAHLETPLREPDGPAPTARYRLRLWSMDRRDTAVELSASFVSPPRFTEGDLKKGIDLALAGKTKQSVAAAAVRIERAGLLRIPGEFRGLRWSPGALRACEQQEEFLAVQPGFVWITGEIDPQRGQAPAARAERTAVASGEDKAIQFTLRGREKVVCDLAGEGRGPVLLIAASRIGRPAVELIGQGRNEQVNTDRIVVGDRGSLSLSLHPGASAARIWSASIGGEDTFEVRLMQISFPVPESGGSNDLQGVLAGKKARLYDLPKGRKRMTLSLGEALAAALLKGDTVASVHWAEGNAFTEIIDTDADRVLLLHTRDGVDRYAIEPAPLSVELAVRPLAVGEPFERIALNSGRLRLPLAAGKSSGDARRALHIRGGKNMLFTNNAGTVQTGADVVIGEQGGTLTIDHGPGAVLCWLDRPGEEAADLWASGVRPDRVPITLPGLLNLDGKVRGYRIDAGKAVMLHVRSAGAAATYVDRGERTPDVEIYPQGVTLDAYLPKGTAELRLRALAGGSLSGQVVITASPVMAASEGLGPEVLLAPGAARLFSFTVRQESMIGAGVKADSDGIDMEILNSTGAILGKGVAQMLRLKPGTYLMKVQAPDSSGPIRARPALVGLKMPDTGPPPEEIRKYLFPESEMPSAYSSSRGAAPAEPVYEGTGDSGDEAARPAPAPEPEPESGEGVNEDAEQAAPRQSGEGEGE